MATVDSHRQATETGRGISDESVSSFECNICYEIAREPVVTVCGHLYCWPCIYRSPFPPVSRPLAEVCRATYQCRPTVWVCAARWKGVPCSGGSGSSFALTRLHTFACRWMQVQSHCRVCPVCKAGIDDEKVRAELCSFV